MLCASVWFTDVQISGSLSVSGVIRVVWSVWFVPPYPQLLLHWTTRFCLWYAYGD